jgi:WD40 repeat protein
MRRLTLLHTRTLRMTDEVLCVKYTPNGKLVAVALMDATVKVFFTESLKFFLSLYGHKVHHILTYCVHCVFTCHCVGNVLDSYSYKMSNSVNVQLHASISNRTVVTYPDNGRFIRQHPLNHWKRRQKHQNLGSRFRRLP